jgi:hypothetical protein
MNNMFIFEQDFMNWKKRDALILIRPMLKSYYELLDIKEVYNNKKRDISLLDRKLNKLKKNIKIIGGEEGLNYLKKRQIPVFKSEKKISEIEKTVKKAFWDILEENINNKNYDQIPLLLNDIKIMLDEIIDNKSFLKSIFEYIDIELITKLIKEDGFNFSLIYSYIKYLIDILYKILPPSDDEKTKLFQENIDIMFKNQKSVGEILRYFFEEYFIKLEYLKVLTIEIKKILNIKKKDKIIDI